MSLLLQLIFNMIKKPFDLFLNKFKSVQRKVGSTNTTFMAHLLDKWLNYSYYIVIIPAHPAAEVAAGLRTIDPQVTGSILDARIQLHMHNQALEEARRESWNNLVANLQDPMCWASFFVIFCLIGSIYVGYRHQSIIFDNIQKAKLSLSPDTLNDSVLRDYDN